MTAKSDNFNIDAMKELTDGDESRTCSTRTINCLFSLLVYAPPLIYFIAPKYASTRHHVPPESLVCSVLLLAIHSSSLSTKGSSLSVKSSTLISSPCHCCSRSAMCFGGISTFPTTWITPSLAIPSSMVTVEKPLILMLMIRPKRKTSTLKDLSLSAVWRSA